MKNKWIQAKRIVRAFHSEEAGQDLIEYGLIGALIALAAIAGMGSLANSINAAFITVGNQFSNAI